MKTSRAILAFGCAFGITLVSSAARLQDVNQKITADALFREGRKLLNAGSVAEACQKFAESQKLDPAAGTQLNLAECYERIGQNAAAWITFKDAARAASARGRPDWEKTATERALALEKKLARLVVVMPDPPPGVQIKRDDVLVPEAALGVAVPVDPGRHGVTVSAPSKKPWSTTVDIRAGTSVTLAVPMLEDAAKVEAPEAPLPTGSPARVEPPPRASFLATPAARTIAIVGAAAGGASIIAGAITGGLALSKRSDAEAKCESYPSRCTPEGADLNDSASTLATVSTVTFIAGGVLAVAGVALLVASSSARAGVAVDRSGARLSIAGRF